MLGSDNRALTLGCVIPGVEKVHVIDCSVRPFVDEAWVEWSI